MDAPTLPLTDPDQRLRLYLQTADVVLLRLDAAGRIVEINRKGCELLGFSEAELLGRDWFSGFVPASERQRVRQGFERLMAGEVELLSRLESAVVTRDGSLRTLSWHNALLRGGAGEPSGVLSSGEDITEHQATAELVERLAAGTAAVVGEGFQQRLVRELGEALDARCALVGEVDAEARQLRVVAAWPRDGYLGSFAFPLVGSPLAPRAGGSLRLVSGQAAQRFPSDPLLQRYHAEALLAIDLCDPAGSLLGVLAVLFERVLADSSMAQGVMRLFGARAAAELARVVTERALEEAKELAEVTLQSIGDAVLTTDPAGRLTGLNPAAERLVGWSAAEAAGRPLAEVARAVDEVGGEALEDPVEACFRDGRAVALPAGSALRLRDGSYRAVSGTASPIRDHARSVVGSVLALQDVTAERRLARTLAWRATHDPLTGLLSRDELERRLSAALQDAMQTGDHHVLCYLDLDQFKVVNDLCGHQAGDELLRQLAALLQRQIRAEDDLARLGGDEFALLLGACPIERARRLGQGICSAVRGFRFAWEGRVFPLGMSIGIVPVTAGAPSASWLLARADAACYAAKDLGRNRVHVDREGDPELVRRHLEMSQLSDLIAGLEQGRFRLVFQPIVPLHGADGGLHGEVLLRFTDESGHAVSAGGFIPAAERYNLMTPLDVWVVRTALGHFGRRLEAGEAIGSVAINLSSNTVSDPAFGDRVRDLLDGSRFPPERVWFEITETAAVNNLDQAVRLMEGLRRLGCRFALDDFGSGLSSFRLLRSLPLDLLKIDGSFVHSMREDAVDRAVVESTTRVARAMGIATVAEGVDDLSLLPVLRDLGIDYAQGFAVGGPRPLESLCA